VEWGEGKCVWNGRKIFIVIKKENIHGKYHFNIERTY
jgi:hypothetical protein